MAAHPVRGGLKPRPLRGLVFVPASSAEQARFTVRNEHAPLSRGGLAEREGFEPPIPC
jgi:hypothetical protein